MNDLIERLEKLSWPDRELDCRIWLALFDKQIMTDGGGYGPKAKPPTYTSAREIWTDSWPYWNEKTQVESVGMSIGAGFYTASIDAALTLVPDGRGWIISRHDDNGSCWAEIDGPSYRGATPAIALCIASLRARLGM